jgi:hypothetical protein
LRWINVATALPCHTGKRVLFGPLRVAQAKHQTAIHVRGFGLWSLAFLVWLITTFKAARIAVTEASAQVPAGARSRCAGCDLWRGSDMEADNER